MDGKKKCPYCGEEILAVAKKCKHCGQWLESNGVTSSSVEQNNVANVLEEQESYEFDLPFTYELLHGKYKKIFYAAIAAIVVIAGGIYYYLSYQSGSMAEINRLFAQGKDKDAIEMLTKVAKRGDKVAQYRLGMRYSTGKAVEQDFKQAAYWIKQSAEAGFDSAQVEFGIAYLGDNNLDVGEKNNEKGIMFLEKAANSGNSTSQYLLAVVYLANKHVPMDLSKAEFWAKKHAENKDEKYSQLACELLDEIALKYFRNDNYPKGFELALLAAEHDYASSQYRVALCYALGQGVDMDYLKADEWMKKAAANGCDEAIDFLND